MRNIALIEEEVATHQVERTPRRDKTSQVVSGRRREELVLAQSAERIDMCCVVSHLAFILLPCGAVALGETTNTEVIWTIVVGAGAGTRFGGLKQYETIGGRRIIDVSVAVARECSDGVVVVVPADDAEREQGVPGGATRSASVRAGLFAVPDEATIICVHDAARPFADVDLYHRVIDAVRAGADGAVPGVEVTDTIKVVADDHSGRVISTPSRSTLTAVQTPQAFRAGALRAAHDRNVESTVSPTDDAMMVERDGVVVVVAGDRRNRKITTQEDLVWARGEVER